MSAIHAKSGWSQGSDFTNNFISDLGPLLALFGEQVAKQFMSESMGWADSIIFAMGPLGIITAMVGAIRVGGPSWLKAIIGRARENRAVAEVELMSSTSHEVCELWNGQQIVRIMGSPEIRELIRIDRKDKARIFTTLEQAMKEEMVSKVKERSICSLKWLLPPWKKIAQFSPKIKTDTVCPEAQTSQNLEVLPRPGTRQKYNEGHQPASGPQKTDGPQTPAEKPDIKKIAPNISLNMYDRSGRHELHIVAVIGTAFQSFVLIYGGFATYHPKLKYPKEGAGIAVYAFPLTSIGTLFLVVGLLVCSYVIERSTREQDYELKGAGANAHILWLQKNATVGDQEFESYAIFAKDKRNIITTSRRSNENDPSNLSKNGSSTSSEVLSTAGTVITLCGFFGQFIGLRGLHWSITFAQLGVTLIMVILRAWVRRGLAKRPYIQLLPPKHEIDWLATRITHETCDLWRESGASPLSFWRKAWGRICMRQEPSKVVRDESFWSGGCFDWGITTGEDAHRYECLSAGALSGRTGRIDQVVQSRKELGWLTKWPGSGLDYATSVTAAIDLVMNTLMSSDSFGNELFWTMCAPGDQLIKFKIQRSSGSKWSADVAEIEATLSLWLYSVREKEQANYDDNDKSAWLKSEMPSKRQGLRLLGKSTTSSRRDMKWWIGNGISRLFQVGMPSTSEDGITTEGVDTIIVENHRVVGFRDHGSAPGPPISQNWSGSLIYKSQHLREDLTSELSSLDENANLIAPANPERALVIRDQEDPRLSLAVVSDAPIGLLFSQDMFSSFMWAVAKTVSRQDMALLMGPAIVQQADEVSSAENAVWKSFTLKNPTLSKIIRGIERTGLGSQEEIYLSIIPPLSANGKLPDPSAVVQLAREEAKKQECAGQSRRAAEVYLWAFHACMSFGYEHTIGIKASIAMTEFIRSISITAKEREHQSRIVESSTASRLKAIQSTLSSELVRSSSPPVLGVLARMYDSQHRGEGCDKWRPAQDLEPQEPNFDSQILCRTKLHDAVINGDPELARTQLESSVYNQHLETKDIFGWTPLHYAACLGDPSSFGRLLDGNADANSTDIAGWTPLHYIIWTRREEPDLWPSLLRHNLNLDVQGQDGLAPLHCAAIRNDVRMAEYLIECGAKVGTLDNNGRTPLHCAASFGSIDVVMLLCEDVHLNLPDKHGRTPLHLAAIKGDEGVVKILSGIPYARKDIRDHDGMVPILLAAKYLHEDAVKAFLECDSSADGFTALHVAVQRGYTSVARELLTAGADKEALTPTGLTALHLASLIGNAKMIPILFNAGVNKNALEPNNRTALHMATIGQHLEVIELLLNEHIDTEVQDSKNCTALHWAISEGILQAVKMLLPYPGINLKDNKGWTVLHRAVIRSDYEIVAKLLLETNVEKDVADIDGQSALYLACERGYDSIAAILVSSGANLEIRNKQGWKAIHTAAAQGNKCVELLLNAGAEKDTPDTSGMTPLHLAIQGTEDGHVLVVQILLYSGADIKVRGADQRTLLHRAAQAGSRSIETLLKVGMDKNAIDNEGSTPLHLAILSKHESCVRSLLDSGADIEAADKNKHTPLHLAARGKYTSGVIMLLGRADREKSDKDGYTPLHWAVKKGNFEIVELFMGFPLDKGSRNKKGRTALHLAAQGGNPDIVDILISRGWDVNTQDRKHWTPLHWAAYNGHDFVIQSILDAGVNKEARDKGGLTPLHLAAERGYPLVILTLLNGGMDTGSEDIVGRTPLHLAATRGDLRSIEMLLQGKAQCNAKDNLMSTPLQYAAFHGNDEAIRALLHAGADITLMDQDGTALHYAAHKGHQSSIQVLLENGADPNEVNKNLWSASHIAAYGGHLRVLKVLANFRANFRAKNKDGSTPLHMALRGGHLNVVKAILGNGTEATTAELHYAAYIGSSAEIERLYNTGVSLQLTDAAGLTALHHAASNGHDEALVKLLELGAYTSSKDTYGHTPLFEATTHSRYDCLKLLLDKGAEVDSQSIVGWTALHCASYEGKDLIAKALLQFHADTEIKTNNGGTALSLACDVGNESVVRLLLVAGANVNPRDGSGWTALHGAVHGGHQEVLKVLLEAKVDLNATLKDGSTAFHVAACLGHLEVVKILQKAGVDIWALNRINGWTAVEYAASSKYQEIVDFLLSEEVVSPAHVQSQMPETDGTTERLVRQGLELRAEWERKICGGEEEERGKEILKSQVRVVL